jgi:hypothetical protein
MKTILTRMKTVVQDNMAAGQTLAYVKLAEAIHPEIAVIDINQSMCPGIFFAPGPTAETWVASQRKEAVHRVDAYLVMYYTQRELNIIGDATRGQNGKGLLDFENDFLTVFRGHRLSLNGELYLDKPMDVEEIDRYPSQIDENVFLITSKIRLLCTRLFTQATLPGDI